MLPASSTTFFKSGRLCEEEGTLTESEQKITEEFKSRADSISRRKWLAKWIGEYEQDIRLNFLRKSLADSNFRPFMNVEEAETLCRQQTDLIVLRLSTTWAGYLSVTYHQPKCIFCHEFEETYIEFKKCLHVIGEKCFVSQGCQSICSHCQTKSDWKYTYDVYHARCHLDEKTGQIVIDSFPPHLSMLNGKYDTLEDLTKEIKTMFNSKTLKVSKTDKMYTTLS